MTEAKAEKGLIEGLCSMCDDMWLIEWLVEASSIHYSFFLARLGLSFGETGGLDAEGRNGRNRRVSPLVAISVSGPSTSLRKVTTRTGGFCRDHFQGQRDHPPNNELFLYQR